MYTVTQLAARAVRARALLTGLVVCGLPFTTLAQVHIFTTDTLIADGDTTWDGYDIVVQGCTVTINGAHAFNSVTIERNASNLPGIVTHAAGFSNGTVNGMHLTVAGDVLIQGSDGALVASLLTATARGFGPHTGPGAGVLGANFGSGGGYGGHGGRAHEGQAGGGVYGLFMQPTELGSGGAGDNDNYNQLGGAGGGAVHLMVGGTLTVNGQLRADGGNGAAGTSESAGGGSGGSLWIEAGALTGTGTIAARGGNAGDARSGGGGGGRIAVYSDNVTFGGIVSACGGTGYVRGGAGTRFSKSSAQLYGDLRIDNEGAAGAITDLPAPISTIDGLTVAGAAILDLPGATTLTITDLNVLTSGLLTHRAGEAGFQIDAAGDVYIAADGRLDVSARGYGPHTGPGAGALGPSFGGGGGHGGYGGSSNGGQAGGSVYGSFTQPVELGSGGAGDNDSYNEPGGAGGGAVHLIVGGTLTVDGQLLADGGNGESGYSESAGGGSGGSIWIEMGWLTGTGTIAARGGNAGDTRSGGGGGGRIAIYCSNTAFTFGGTISACGGTGYIHGGAGSRFSKAAPQPHGDLLLDNDGTAGAITDLPVPIPTVDVLTVAGAAILDFPGATVLSVTDLNVLSNGIVTHRAEEAGFQIDAAGDVVIAADGRIDVSARGYGPHTGPGAGTLGPSFGGGGGYGGHGGSSNGGQAGGGVYGSFIQPAELGSGGAGDNDGFDELGGAGGGAIRLTVGGTLTVDGQLLANGGNGESGYSESAGGGSGGSIWIEAATLAGTGTIAARGGNAGDTRSGGGGGGRIAIYTCDQRVDPAQIVVTGGSGWQGGGSGTVTHVSAFIAITQQPVGGIVFAGDPLQLSIAADTTQGTLTYQWRRDQTDLSDDGHYAGVQTETLTVAAAALSDQGYYDVWLTDDCGMQLSQSAYVIVPPPGDVTCDGVVSFADINPFVLALSNPTLYEQLWPQCRLLQADCNGNGMVDFRDINPFVALLTGK